MVDDAEFKKRVGEIRFNIRATMQHIQMQYDVFRLVTETCDVHIANDRYDDCLIAMDSVIKESSKFIRYNTDLIDEMNELRKLVYAKTRENIKTVKKP
jgi:hypothetical protein